MGTARTVLQGAHWAVAGIALLFATDQEEPSPLQVEQLAPGVFTVGPTPAAFESWRSISNSGAIVLDDGLLVFDSHWTPELAEEALRLLREHTQEPLEYVVSSHFHGDHTGGYWAYGRDVEILAQHATRDRMVADLPAAPERLRAEIAEQETQIAGIQDPAQRERLTNFLRANQDLLTRLESLEPRPFPTLTFDRSLVLHRGRTVELHFLGRGHTDGDVLCYLPAERIAFLGDLLFSATLPNLGDGHSLEWIETLEAVLELGATRFVPGHGPVTDAEGVRELIAYLRWLRAAVEPYVTAGQTLEEAQAGITIPAQYADHAFPFMLGVGVEKVFAELRAGR